MTYAKDIRGIRISYVTGVSESFALVALTAAEKEVEYALTQIPQTNSAQRQGPSTRFPKPSIFVPFITPVGVCGVHGCDMS